MEHVTSLQSTLHFFFNQLKKRDDSTEDTTSGLKLETLRNAMLESYVIFLK